MAVVKGLFEAFGRQDMQAIFDLIHPECEIYLSSRCVRRWGSSASYEELGH